MYTTPEKFGNIDLLSMLSEPITDQSAESINSSGQEALSVLLTANKIHNPYYVL